MPLSLWQINNFPIWSTNHAILSPLECFFDPNEICSRKHAIVWTCGIFYWPATTLQMEPFVSSPPVSLWQFNNFPICTIFNKLGVITHFSTYAATIGWHQFWCPVVLQHAQFIHCIICRFFQPSFFKEFELEKEHRLIRNLNLMDLLCLCSALSPGCRISPSLNSLLRFCCWQSTVSRVLISSPALPDAANNFRTSTSLLSLTNLNASLS